MKLPLISKIFKRDSEYYNVIDLGSSRIKVAVCKPKSDVKPLEVLGIGIKPVPNNSMYGGQILNLDAVIDTLDLALEEVTLKSSITAKKTLIGLSGGVVHSKSYRVRIRRENKDVGLSSKEFEKLAKEVEEKTLARATEDFNKEGFATYIRIESVFTGYMVDGVKVITPIDLPGSEIEITVLHYFMDEARIRLINSLLDQLNLEAISVVDTSTAVALALNETYGDYIFIDIGGSVTQVVVIERSKVMATGSLFIGGVDIGMKIADKFQMTLEQAENMKLQYTQGHLDQNRSFTVHQEIEKVIEILVEAIADFLKSVKANYLPSNMVIGGEVRHLTEIKSAFASYPWMKEGKFNTFPKVEILSGQDPVFDNLAKMQL